MSFFGAKTANIMKNLQFAHKSGIATATPHNDPLFAQFADKGKVPQALVRAAFTRTGLQARDAHGYVHSHRDIQRLAQYVYEKANNKNIPVPDRIRLLNVHTQLSQAVTERKNQLVADSVQRIRARQQQPMCVVPPAPKRTR